MVKKNSPFLILILPVLGILSGCAEESLQGKGFQIQEKTGQVALHADERISAIQAAETMKAEKIFTDSGLINVQSVVPNIRVDLRYSSTRNLAGTDMYGQIENAYLIPEAVSMLRNADSVLSAQHPGHHFLILDAARPLFVQKVIWDSTPLPLNLKVKYLSNPANHSIHNYGAAVDLTIVDEDGLELDMGTPFDFFGPEAQPVREKEMLKAGKITEEQINNREILRSTMVKAGFKPFPYEWWHFNACSRDEAKRKLKLIP